MSYSYQESSFSSSGSVGGAADLGFSAGSAGSAGGLSGGFESVSFSSGGGAGAGFSSFSSGGGAGAGFSSFSSNSGAGGASNSVNQIASDLLQLQRSGGASGAFGADASASAGGAAGGALSAIEAAILRSTVPIDINETEEITVLGQRGIWANKSEVVNWRGQIPITEYVINEDANPEVITKRSTQQLTYVQELAIRYLRPPTPPQPGEIVITQESSGITAPAPPIIIRQQPARPGTPEPLVIREAPPQAPQAVGRKVITISGRRLPPPPRKVVIERLAPLPSKPQSVLVERWLPYSQVKRRVIFQRAAQRDAVAVKPRNIIVQWEAPQVQIKKEFKYLGVIRANPAEYVQRYGATLKTARELPQFVLDIKTPDGLVLAADSRAQTFYELEGDLQALGLVDLDREGLGEYRAYLSKLGISFNAGGLAASGASFGGAASGASFGGAASGASFSSSASFGASGASFGGASGASAGGASFGGASGASAGGASQAVITEIFNSVDSDHNGKISISEANAILLRLNSRLNRQYGENEIRAFFQALDTNNDGSIDLQEFKRAYERL